MLHQLTRDICLKECTTGSPRAPSMFKWVGSEWGLSACRKSLSHHRLKNAQIRICFTVSHTHTHRESRTGRKNYLHHFQQKVLQRQWGRSSESKATTKLYVRQLESMNHLRNSATACQTNYSSNYFCWYWTSSKKCVKLKKPHKTPVVNQQD